MMFPRHPNWIYNTSFKKSSSKFCPCFWGYSMGNFWSSHCSTDLNERYHRTIIKYFSRLGGDQRCHPQMTKNWFVCGKTFAHTLLSSPQTGCQPMLSRNYLENSFLKSEIVREKNNLARMGCTNLGPGQNCWSKLTPCQVPFRKYMSLYSSSDTSGDGKTC